MHWSALVLLRLNSRFESSATMANAKSLAGLMKWLHREEWIEDDHARTWRHVEGIYSNSAFHIAQDWISNIKRSLVTIILEEINERLNWLRKSLISIYDFSPRTRFRRFLWGLFRRSDPSYTVKDKLQTVQLAPRPRAFIWTHGDSRGILERSSYFQEARNNPCPV